jgi:serine-type D-Ala-D-Ala carboxypeptidase (penicillin-binding protein 5/6)
LCWAIYDCKTKSLLKGKYETYRREVASITKMMTFYTVINIIEEYKIDPSQTFISVCRQATSIIGTSADLREDDILSIRQLFYGMMLPSGNDAAFLLAEYFG